MSKKKHGKFAQLHLPGIVAVAAMLLVFGCSTDEIKIYIDVSGAPESTNQLRVMPSLNNVPSSMPKIYSKNLSIGRIGLYLPKDSTGLLVVDMDALDMAGCVLARGYGSHTIAPEVIVPISWTPSMMMECPGQDSSLAHSDMACEPKCSPGICNVDDKCGGKCLNNCNNGDTCCHMEMLCGACCPGATQRCDCPSPLNATWTATEFCNNMAWGQCILGKTPIPVKDMYAADFDHSCGYRCTGSHGTPDPMGTQWCAGPGDPSCFVQKGPRLSLPKGSYQMQVFGYAANNLHLTIDVWDGAKSLVSQSVDPPNGDAPFMASLLFDNPAGCPLLEFRIQKGSTDSIQLYHTVITAQ